MNTENSGFENIEDNTVIPCNAITTELLPFQSNSSLVYKTKINNKWLLLKRILHEYREHPAYINSLEKEFNLGFNLDHPHIVKYLNKGHDSEGLYLIAEYIDGFTLRNIIQKNSHGIKDYKLIDKILCQLLDALNYLHKQQIFHLDLKPENIIITHKGNNVKIIDFGLSGSDSYISVSSGTKKYCSPEQLKNPENVDARSDFYSLGIILLEILTGNTDLSNLKNTPIRYKKIISKCIESLQENRFNSSEEIIILLNKKSQGKILSIIAIVVSILIIVVFGIKYFHQNVIINTTTKQKQNLQYNNLSSSETKFNSKVEQNIVIKKTQKYLTNQLSVNDSLFCCKIGNKIFSVFIEQVRLYDLNPINRNRKLVLLDIKEKCIDSLNDSLNKRLSRYEKGSIEFIKLNDLFTKHSDYSLQKIDSIIYKKN